MSSVTEKLVTADRGKGTSLSLAVTPCVASAKAIYTLKTVNCDEELQVADENNEVILPAFTSPSPNCIRIISLAGTAAVVLDVTCVRDQRTTHVPPSIEVRTNHL
jgi:hypothetical protein